MRKDERDLVEVLKFELKFLETGGYHIFTLVYDRKYGIVLTLLMPELPLVHIHDA